MKRHQYMTTIDEEEDTVYHYFEVTVTRHGESKEFYGKTLPSTLKRAMDHIILSEALEA